jgi:hypothetical protein
MGTLTIAFAVFCLCVWATPAEKSKPTPIAAWLDECEDGLAFLFLLGFIVGRWGW